MKLFMNIRKLILNFNLQHIENQSPYLFVFHCSGLTNSQWKQLKNTLHTTNANTNTFSHKKTTGGTFFIPSGRSKLNSSEHFHKINSKLTFNAGPLCIIYFNQIQTENTLPWVSFEHSTEKGDKAPISKDSALQTVKGSLNHFGDRGKADHADQTWSEIVSKIAYLEANPNFVLLFAKIESTLINHIDLKQALTFTTKSVFKPLLWSILSPSQQFCFNMLQPVHESFSLFSKYTLLEHNELKKANDELEIKSSN